MISSVSSNLSSYLTSTSSTSSTATATANAKKFQADLLAKLDSDGNGKISSSELKTALSDSKTSTDGQGASGVLVSLSKDFSSLDSDSDDSLSLDELAAMAPPPLPPQDGAAPDTDAVDQLMTAIDSSGDGSISSDELSTALTQVSGTSDGSSTVFSLLDTNKDGTVSSDELAAAMAPPPPPSEASSYSDTASDDSTSAVSASSSQSDSAKSIEAAALAKMIASLSQRYQLNDTQALGSQVTTAA